MTDKAASKTVHEMIHIVPELTVSAAAATQIQTVNYITVEPINA